MQRYILYFNQSNKLMLKYIKNKKILIYSLEPIRIEN